MTLKIQIPEELKKKSVKSFNPWQSVIRMKRITRMARKRECRMNLRRENAQVLFCCYPCNPLIRVNP
jgi:hypothetical protein